MFESTQKIFICVCPGCDRAGDNKLIHGAKHFDWVR